MSGFSQGCFTSTATLLRYEGPKPFGGIICLSGLQPMVDKNILKTPKALQLQSQVPFLQYHGTTDTTVTLQDAQYTHKYLKDVVYKNNQKNYTFKIEEGLRHTIGRDEIKYIRKWFDKNK